MLQQDSSLPHRRAGDSPGTTEGFDAVTGVADRALFRSRVELDWQRGMRSQQRVSVILFSIDRFRELGTVAAEECLRMVAKIIQLHCRRRADFIGRMREHEFAILLSGATRQGARKMAESICKDIAVRKYQPAGFGRVVTVSGGMASLVPRPARCVDSLLVIADTGLRESRRLGGNQVRISSKLR